MKPLIAAAIGALTLAVAAPALAQDWHRDEAPSGWDIDRREHWLDERVERGLEDGSLSRKEAHKVHDKIRDVRQLEERMRHRDGGRLYEDDRIVLEHKLDEISDRIHWDRENHEMAPWRH